MNDQQGPLTPFRIPGRRAFVAANVVLLLFGAVHVLAVYNANFGKPPNEQFAALDRDAKALIFPMGPFHPTAFGLIQILNSAYSVLLLYVAAVNFVALGPVSRAGRLRLYTGLQVLFTGLILGITIIYQFPPPMAFAGLAFLLFAISWVQQGARASR